MSRPSRLRLMVVEQGTASRWWELLGSVGTHWLLLLAFCSLLGREYAYTLKYTHMNMTQSYKRGHVFLIGDGES